MKIISLILFLTSGLLYSQSADSTVMVKFANNSGESIDVSAMSFPDSSVITVVDTLTYPFTIADDDTLDIEFVIDRDQPDSIYSYSLTINSEYIKQYLSFTINIIGDTTGAGAPEPSASSNIWWVASGGLGSQTGTDSANAWSSASIVWDSLDPGDSIYFIEGTYTGTINIGASGDENNLLTFMTNPTNTGDVLFTGSGSKILINDDDYIRLLGFTFRNLYGAVRIEPTANVIYLDSLTISKFSTQGGGITVIGYPNVTDIDSIFIRYCTIHSDSILNSQNDAVYAQYFSNLFIDNCHIEQNNVGYKSQHNDALQVYNFNNITVSNSYINVDGNGLSTQPCQAIMLESAVAGSKTILYNNVFNSDFTNTYGNTVYLNKATVGNYYVYGNTFIGGYNLNLLTIYGDSAFIKNNIFYHRYVITSPSIRLTVANLANLELDGSLTSTNVSSEPLIVNGSAYNRAEMLAAGWEATGTFVDRWRVDPLFTNFGTLDLSLQAGSPAIDVGVTLGSPYNVDILGVTRPVGAGYDIGAMEYNP